MPGAAELRTLQRRINSVRSTQKITHAMELIAASRITRARQAVEAARPYAEMITRVIRDLAAESTIAGHPLLTQPETVSHVGVVIVSADRGLAGAYNANILRRAERLIDAEGQQGREVSRYVIGRKAQQYYRFQGTHVAQTWTGLTDRPRYPDAQSIGERVVADYAAGEIHRVWLCYTDFRSALRQVPSVAQLLPVEQRQLAGGAGYTPEFMFEPDPQSILERLVPRYLDHRIYAGLLESSASEHASRQRAMSNATDNANEMIENLTREANAARQAAITTEISEIVAGAEALSSS
jgi:F-type H+-transporting ATPase subunit gamma